MRYGSQLGGQWRGIILRRPGKWNNMCSNMQLWLYGVRNVHLWLGLMEWHGVMQWYLLLKVACFFSGGVHGIYCTGPGPSHIRLTVRSKSMRHCANVCDKWSC